MATDNAVVSLIAGEAHFADHLLPVWRELPPERRGVFYIGAAHVHRFDGIDGVEALPFEGKVRGLDLVVVAAIGDVKRAPGARVVLMEHGAGQSYSNRHSSYVGGMGRGDVELVLVPNNFAAGRHRRHYPSGPPVEVVGCPKLDELLDLPAKPRGTPPVVAVSFHWQPREAPVPEVGSAWPAMGRAILDELDALASTGAVEVLGHAHPRIAEEVFAEYDRRGWPVAPTFDDVVERADVYVVDNSSTLFEFAALGRPVVVVNAPQYRRLVNHGLRFWRAATIGPNVNAATDVGPAVLAALADGPELRRSREDAVRLAYSVLDGTSARRAAMAILSSESAGAAVSGRSPIPNTKKGPTVLKVFRTADGDFRLSDEGAIARGLLPSPSGLFPAVTARRLRRCGATTAAIERIAIDYVALDDEGKAKALSDLAMTSDGALRGQMAELVAELRAEVTDGPVYPVEVPQPPDPPASTSGPTTTEAEVLVGPELAPPPEATPAPAPEVVVPVEEEVRAKVLDAVANGRVGDVTAAVGTDPALAAVALEAERAGKARPSLVSELERLATGG